VKWEIVLSAIAALFTMLTFFANIFLYFDSYKQKIIKIKTPLKRKADKIYFYSSIIISSISILMAFILLTNNLIFNIKFFSKEADFSLLYSSQAYVGYLFFFISVFLMFLIALKFYLIRQLYISISMFILSIFSIFFIFFILYMFDFDFGKIFLIIKYTFVR